MRELSAEEFGIVAGGSGGTSSFWARVQSEVRAAGPMALMPVAATMGFGGLIFTIGLAIYRVAREQQT